MKAWNYLVVILLLAASAVAQLPSSATIEEALPYNNRRTNLYDVGVSRTNYPVRMGWPLADSEGITSVSQLGLIGTTYGQFRILGSWPSGNAKSVEVITRASLTANGKNTAISLCKTPGIGSCNTIPPGSMATDNTPDSDHITVATGAAVFTIKKSHFNFLDSVTVGGTSVVAAGNHGATDGMTLWAAAYPTSTCAPVGSDPCTTVYSSQNDANSTAVIEQDGSLLTVVRVEAALKDSGGNIYMRGKCRLLFWQGATRVEAQCALANADYGLSSTFTSATKGYRAFELQVKLNLGGTGSNTYTIPETTAGTMTGTDSVYLIQGHSTMMECNSIHNENSTDTSGDQYVPVIARTTHTGSGCGSTWDWALKGYQVNKVSGVTSTLATNTTDTSAAWVEGWADIQDSNGLGAVVGLYDMATYWPAALQFDGGGSQVRIGLRPDQNMWVGGGGIPYYQLWPQYSLFTAFVEFHATALSTSADDFKAAQYYLVGRPSIPYINNTSIFNFKLVDSTVEDSYYQSIGLTCCLTDIRPVYPRAYTWHMGGGGNQMEMRFLYFTWWLQRGYTSYLIWANKFYQYQLQIGEWSDYDSGTAFHWRQKPVGNCGNSSGWPNSDAGSGGGDIVSLNLAQTSGTNVWWPDGSHANLWGIMNLYWFTGNEWIRDYAVGPLADRWANPNTCFYKNLAANNGNQDTRIKSFGMLIPTKVHDFLASIGQTTDAANAYTAIGMVLDAAIYPAITYTPTNTSGFKGAGTSYTRGFQFGPATCLESCQGTYTGSCGGGNQLMTAATFYQGIFSSTLWEYLQSRATWTGGVWSPQGGTSYTRLFDIAYGDSRFALGENWNTTNNRFAYCSDLMGSNVLPMGVSQTVWGIFHMALHHDFNQALWRSKFEAQLNAACNSPNNGSGGCTEFGNYIDQDIIWNLTYYNNVSGAANPRSTQALTPSPATCGPGVTSCRVSWTPPTGASSYRLKQSSAGTIVDSLNYNSLNATFGYDPASYVPWFAASDTAYISNGATSYYDVTGLDAAKTYSFAVTATLNGDSDGGSSGGATMRGVLLKGGVVK